MPARCVSSARVRGRYFVCGHSLLTFLLLTVPASARTITAEEAVRVAETFAGSVVGENHGVDSRLYLDTRNEPAVYLCECRSADGSPVTLMVGAETGMPPVLMYYRGPLGELVTEPAAQAAAALALGSDARPVSRIYYSPFDLWQEYESDGSRVMVSLRDLSTCDPGRVRSAAPIEYDFKQRARFEREWVGLLEGRQPWLDGQQWIDGVPDWDWHYGCAPTAAANVLTWWDQRGYHLLVDSVMYDVPDRVEGDRDSVPNVTFQLAEAMSTDTAGNGSTASDSIAAGIVAVCSDSKWGNGYSFDSYLSWHDHELLVYEINAGRPGVLGLMGHPEYGNHCVTFCGWGPPDERWIMVRDTRGGTGRDVVINFDYGAPVAVIPVMPAKAPAPDLAISAMVQPADTVALGAIRPRVTIDNLGNSAGTATVCFSITPDPTATGDMTELSDNSDRVPSPAYSESTSVTVEPGKAAMVVFPVWQGAAGTYFACCSLAGTDKVLRRTFVMSATAESPRFEQGEQPRDPGRQLLVYPNPVRAGMATVRCFTAGTRDMTQTPGVWDRVPSLAIYDASGRCVLRPALNVERLASGVALDLRDLTAGVYLLSLTRPGVAPATARFLVAR